MKTRHHPRVVLARFDRFPNLVRPKPTKGKKDLTRPHFFATMADCTVRPVFIDTAKYITPEELDRVFTEVQNLHDRLLKSGLHVPSLALIAMMRISLQAMRSREEVRGDLQKYADQFFAEQEAIALAFEEQRVLHERKASEALRKREARALKRKERALEQLGVSDPDAPVDEGSASDQQPRKRRRRPTVRLGEDEQSSHATVSYGFPDCSVVLSPPEPK